MTLARKKRKIVVINKNEIKSQNIYKIYTLLLHKKEKLNAKENSIVP